MTNQCTGCPKVAKSKLLDIDFFADRVAVPATFPKAKKRSSRKDSQKIYKKLANVSDVTHMLKVFGGRIAQIICLSMR